MNVRADLQLVGLMVVIGVAFVLAGEAVCALVRWRRRRRRRLLAGLESGVRARAVCTVCGARGSAAFPRPAAGGDGRGLLRALWAWLDRAIGDDEWRS